MKIVLCVFWMFLCFLFSALNIYSQTKLFQDKGLNISNSGGIQNISISKAKIIKSKDWGDNFFYIIWADTGSININGDEYQPLDQQNSGSLPNANIFAIKIIKDGNTYKKDDSFGNNGLLRITDRYDQVKDLDVYPYPSQNGFFISYTTSSTGTESAGFVQIFNGNGEPQINSGGDGSNNKSWKIINFSTYTPVVFNKGYFYYIEFINNNIIQCELQQDNSLSCVGNNLNMPASNIVSGFIVPSDYTQNSSGVLVGLQANWDGNGYNLKIKRVSPDYYWSGEEGWVAVTNTNGVYVGEYGGVVRAFSEEYGSTYILWLDTATMPTGIKLAVFNGDAPTHISSNSGTGYHIADVDISSMGVNLASNYFDVNNGRVGLIYFGSNGKKLKIFEFGNSSINTIFEKDLSDSDFNPNNHFFSISSSNYVGLFKRDLAGIWADAGSLYFKAFKDDGDELFPYSIILSSSEANNEKYSFIGVVSLGNNFSLLQHEKKGVEPTSSYNLYLQIVSTSTPPLESLQNLTITKTNDDPLNVNVTVVDPNNIQNSFYTFQISTSSDFSTIIYSTNIINNNTNNPKSIYSLSGLTHGLTYHFRIKLTHQDRETDWISSSFVYGSEMSHLSDMSIGKWSDIRNTFLPLTPYREVNMNILDAGNNQSFYFWSNYSYKEDAISIKVAKFGVNGNKIFEKDLVTGIKYQEDFDNKFGVTSDNNGGFVLLWTFVENNYNYAKIARFNSDAELIWQNVKQINDGSPIFGIDRNIYILGNSVFVLYANNLGQVYYDVFSLSNGDKTNIDLTFTASSNFFVSTTKTSDDSIVIFYGESGSSGSLNAKKINSNGVQLSKSYYITNIKDEDLFSISDNNGGVYFIYLDSSDNTIKIVRVDSSLDLINGYPKDIDNVYSPGWYIYHAAYTPYGPVISYRSDFQKSRVKFWSNSSDEVSQTYENNFGFNKLTIAYNANHDVVSVAGVINNNGKDDVYITQYKANNSQIEYGPIAGVRNLYGFLMMDYPLELVLTNVDDYFMLGYVFSESSYIQQISTYATLNIPTNLVATAIDKNSITLNWTENNDGVTEWYIRYSTESAFSNHTTTISYITQKPYQVSGLSPNTTYYFSVRSSSASVISDYSQPYIKSTFAEIPTNLSVSEKTSNSLKFSWSSNGNGPNTLYNIVLLDQSNLEVSSSTQTQLSKLFDNLSPNTTYFAKVRAIGNNENDVTSFTQQLEAKTLITISDITDIVFSDVSNSSIKVSFNHPSGAKTYQIEISSVSSFNIPSIVITSNTANKYALFGTGGEGSLIPNTTYYFRVKAYYDDDQTEYVNLGERSTDPSQPSNVVISQISQNSASLSWDSNSNPPNTLYNVILISNSDMSEVFSDTISLTNITLSNLTPNTTYFAKIKSIGNQSQSSYVSSQLFRTKVALIGLSNVSFYDVTNSSFAVSWNDSSPGEIAYEVWYATDPYDLLYSSKTLNKYAIFGIGGVGILSPNTTYYAYLKVCNGNDCSQLELLGSTVTHANVPTDFTLLSIYSTSATFSWNTNSNPQDTLYRVRYVSTNHNGQFYFDGNSGIITGLKPETSYSFYLSAINRVGVVTDELTQTGTTDKLLEAVSQIGPNGGIIVFDTGLGEVKLNIPQGAFNSNVTVTVKLPENPPSSQNSLLADVVATNIFVEINISGGLQPSKPTELVIEYPSNITFSPETLTISRYDDMRALWIPYKSFVDKTNRKVRAYVDHFSVFGLLSITPAQNILEPKVVPNPLRPSKGAGYSTMTFSNLPADADIIIYNVTGRKIRHLITDSTGIAVWDGKNDDGGEVSSGVYYVLIKKGSSTKVIKIAVQR